jgi:hypothetical protein
MIKYDTARARAAVQHLVDTSYFLHHLRKLRSTLAKPRALPFRDEFEVLNELLVIGRQSPEAFENLIKLAEFKRDSDKNSYQREYMASKRQRDRKVIKLEETMTGKKLDLDTRRKVLQKQYDVWNSERQQMLDAIADRSWADRNAAIRDFWERKEAEVDALQHEAESHGPVKRRRRYIVEAPQKPTALREAFKKAVDKRR